LNSIAFGGDASQPIDFGSPERTVDGSAACLPAPFPGWTGAGVSTSWIEKGDRKLFVVSRTYSTQGEEHIELKLTDDPEAIDSLRKASKMPTLEEVRNVGRFSMEEIDRMMNEIREIDFPLILAGRYVLLITGRSTSRTVSRYWQLASAIGSCLAASPVK
jgi:hypothetical protein